jgi:glucosyl-3-phosphoglycerate synthase
MTLTTVSNNSVVPNAPVGTIGCNASIVPVSPTPFTPNRNLRSGERLQASICIPARNEELTIGQLVNDLQDALQVTGVVSEIVVLDDRSTDLTRLEAELAGATVYSTGDVLPGFGPSRGKGDAMWRSLVVSEGDIVLWCDGDLQNINVRRLGALVEQLRFDPSCIMAKGYFQRVDSAGQPAAGGRVTELAARPLLSLVAPEAARIHEPLSGIFAMRRWAAERLPFEADYGVDVGLLLDTMHTYGHESIAQIDLGELRHRNQSTEALAVQSASVERAILVRSGFDRHRLGHELHRRGKDTVVISAPLRPPLRSLTSYQSERERLQANRNRSQVLPL